MTEAGAPERAPPAVLARVRALAEPMRREREAALGRAATALAAAK